MIDHSDTGTMATVVAKNFIRSHGMLAFKQLIDMLTANTPCPAIAKVFGVTRQRAHQWKQQLGVEKTTYRLYPEVETILGATSDNRKTV